MDANDDIGNKLDEILSVLKQINTQLRQGDIRVYIVGSAIDEARSEAVQQTLKQLRR